MWRTAGNFERTGFFESWRYQSLSERKWQNGFADKFQWLAITTRVSGVNGWLFI